MNIDKLSQLQDKVYELEGLIELLQQRKDKEAALMPLIESKLKAINEIFGDREQSVAPVSAAPVSVTAAAVAPASVAPTSVTSAPEVREKPKFCINDRFRFRRELFNNSGEDFDRTMSLMSTMKSYDQAEDYFFNNLGMDPEDETVMDFMEIMKQYFGN